MTNVKKRHSILIVDDERDNISSLTVILSSDYTVFASTNGKDAIEIAQEFMPDIILLDILMPEMDGYEVLKAFKDSEKTRDITVIFITGLDSDIAEIKGLALGAADYIIKPFHPAIVKLRILNHIQLMERLKQQALVSRISHNFLANTYTASLNNDTLRMIGEFMDIASILLYRKENNNILVCQDEWINSQLSIEKRIGDKVEFDENVISSINNLLTANERDLCIHSKDELLKRVDDLNRQNFKNYIITPIFVKGAVCAILIFSMDDEEKIWNESEMDLAVLAANIFSSVFERDAIQHAEYLSRAKSEFLSRMSHEMRTPMNAILGMLQVLELSGISDNIRRQCGVMNTAAHTLLRMIDDVLDISDLEYGSFMLVDSAFDCKAMIWDVLRIADENAGKKRQLIECKVDPDIPDSLIGDGKRLRQVITTILANAVKFTGENGEILFEARLESEDSDFTVLNIEVTDNGIGMSKDQQSKLFSIFEQADGSISREYGGIGLGLALSKRIIESMGGNIFIESELNKGTKINFTCKMKKGKL
ncbi:MAG: ATP-binding protein [Treponema sp.]|nr:ATP-binding protein [Treponema sp.]